jgi:deoxycytidylate deaminase
VGKEFGALFAQLPRSGCAKKQTAAGTYVGGEWVVAVNFCDYQGDDCPRLNVASGTHYNLCKSHHAEAELVQFLKRLRGKSDGVVWLVGHYWACEPCASLLKAAGVKEIRIREIA